MWRLFLMLTLFCSALHAEPLADFELIVKRCRQFFEARPQTEVTYTEATKSWSKREYSPIKISYDVKKTDSLVSPLSAFIEVSDIIALEQAVDEGAAKAISLTSESQSLRFDYRINFSFRENVWALTEMKTSTAFRRRGEKSFDRPSSFVQERDAVLKTTSRVSACFPI